MEKRWSNQSTLMRLNFKFIVFPVVMDVRIWQTDKRTYQMLLYASIRVFPTNLTETNPSAQVQPNAWQYFA